jgi:hypothetical protein
LAILKGTEAYGGGKKHPLEAPEALVEALMGDAAGVAGDGDGAARGIVGL